MQMMVELAHKRDRAVVIVTHDPRVLEFADRTIRIEDGLVADLSENKSPENKLAENDSPEKKPATAVSSFYPAVNATVESAEVRGV